ncbi:DUF4240 domain-containing protein [Lentzea sp. BCCO 10_0061]|uniref:DUF4240 domain-containing protein n=1 Tax=Lentzea sokolovensis TaxID=3095429 RepID=A0ABU4VF02_9PSEU|nr:DUF4240 domain-containing protein [Lentzea sp. BCCO 10_0061]MDX8149508.1 DUF4240 domain-containing protein [Lentzea sp. BCCO 10_0061]
MLASEESMLWALVDSISNTARSEQEMAESLLGKLSKLPIPRVARFQRELLDCVNGLLNWRLWEAADVIHERPCSGDTFADFRLWVVAQGSEVCREVLRDPDSLASISEIERIVRLPQPWDDVDYPHFASLGALASDAFDVILGKLSPAIAESIDRPAVLDEQIPAYLEGSFPSDYGVDTAVHVRLPMLSAMRGWSV